MSVGRKRANVICVGSKLKELRLTLDGAVNLSSLDFSPDQSSQGRKREPLILAATCDFQFHAVMCLIFHAVMFLSSEFQLTFSAALHDVWVLMVARVNLPFTLSFMFGVGGWFGDLSFSSVGLHYCALLCN